MNNRHFLFTEEIPKDFFSQGNPGQTKLSRVNDKELFIRKTFEIDSEKGVELLFNYYYRPLCNHAARYVYSRELAEDLVGEVFEHFWRKQLYNQVKTSFQAYLFTAVRHQAFQYLRSEYNKRPMVSLEELDFESLTPNPQQLLQYDELYFEIDKVIQSLSPAVRNVFLMSRFEGKKNAFIAEELHISIKTVEGRKSN
jgi:RNA polymerase sigma-70 factor (family 1)